MDESKYQEGGAEVKPRRHQTEFRELGRAEKIKVVVVAALRLIAVLAVMFVVFSLVPIGGFDVANPFAAWARLAALILAFLTVLVWQVRIVLSASVPQVRALEAVVESLASFLLLFALLYVSLSTTDPLSFSEPLDRVDAFYFTSSTFATVGFGDIVPFTGLARTLATIQMIAGLGVLVLIAKVSFYAAKTGLSRDP